MRYSKVVYDWFYRYTEDDPFACICGCSSWYYSWYRVVRKFCRKLFGLEVLNVEEKAFIKKSES